MNNRQLRTNQGIARNVRQNITTDSRMNQKRINNINKINTSSNISLNNSSNIASNTSLNNESIRTDEAIKINKILNLLNDRLKILESKTTNTETVETIEKNVKFDSNISLSKMNTLFSLMDARISSLENHNKLQDLNIDLEKTTNNSNNTTENVEEKKVADIDSLIDNNKKILDIENKLSSLNKSVSNININGISNNFVKLSNLIKTIKEDCNKQLTNFQATINKALVQKSEISKENSVLQEDTIVPVVEEESVVEEHSVAENETVVEEKSVAENETVVEEKSVAENETVVEEKPVVEEEPVADEVSVVVNEDLFQLKNKTKSLDISMDVDNEKENIKISLEDENS
jgi:hypothetical protein